MRLTTPAATTRSAPALALPGRQGQLHGCRRLSASASVTARGHQPGTCLNNHCPPATTPSHTAKSQAATAQSPAAMTQGHVSVTLTVMRVRCVMGAVTYCYTLQTPCVSAQSLMRPLQHRSRGQRHPSPLTSPVAPAAHHHHQGHPRLHLPAWHPSQASSPFLSPALLSPPPRPPASEQGPAGSAPRDLQQLGWWQQSRAAGQHQAGHLPHVCSLVSSRCGPGLSRCRVLSCSSHPTCS
jgi:hypothetical protein